MCLEASEPIPSSYSNECGPIERCVTWHCTNRGSTHTHSRTTKDHNTIQLEFNILNSQTTVSHTTSGPSTWLYDTGAVSSRPATIHIVCMSHTHTVVDTALRRVQPLAKVFLWRISSSSCSIHQHFTASLIKHNSWLTDPKQHILHSWLY